MSNADVARKLGAGKFKFFTDRKAAMRLYFAIRRNSGKRYTARLEETNAGWRVYKVRAA